ncbi:MAG TPA: sigma-70 family RNA polymerase sigma factor [Rhodocyclaceae bacterium]|nr:sigma-70 family RNA polymerase sigma factor [Rhodocyclaceae bacterium]
MDFVGHLPRLRRYARALTGDRHRADDLVQDTVERALRKTLLFRPGTRLDTWLLAIMHNLFINQLQAAQRQAETALDELSIKPRSPTDPQQIVEVLDIETALAQLPVEQRAVLLLVALEEHSYEDTAAILGIPVGTVMSRLARARERLRSALAGEASGEPPLRRVK